VFDEPPEAVSSMAEEIKEVEPEEEKETLNPKP